MKLKGITKTVLTLIALGVLFLTACPKPIDTTPKTYTVTYDKNGATGGTVPSDSQTYVDGAVVTVLGNTGNLVKTDKYFAGWNTQADGSGTHYIGGSTFIMGNSNVMLYTYWTDHPVYGIVYDANGAETGAVPVDSNLYREGETVTVLGNTGNLVKTGKYFAGWNTQADGSGTTSKSDAVIVIGTSNVILFAKWSSTPPHTVTYDLNGADSGTVPTDTTEYFEGEIAIVLENSGALRKASAVFAGWNTQADGKGTHYWVGNSITMPNTGITLYAQWNTELVACGNIHTIAMKSDGTLWAWGYNGGGQLGDGTTMDRSSPVQVGTAKNWAQVACGDSHTIALKTDGTLWAWGNNYNGQLGDGTTIQRISPVQVGTATNWAQVACGDYHTIAIKSDGTLWTWGWNIYGQLGDGTSGTLTQRNSPVQIGTDTNWAQVACG